VKYLPAVLYYVGAFSCFMGVIIAISRESHGLYGAGLLVGGLAAIVLAHCFDPSW
jgi:hypothetical protein